jgi:hypothetical protein
MWVMIGSTYFSSHFKIRQKKPLWKAALVSTKKIYKKVKTQIYYCINRNYYSRSFLSVIKRWI